MKRALWHRVPHVNRDLGIGDKAADALKHWFGTWTILGLVGAGITFWLLWVHDPGELHLNLGLSCIAAVQGIILQISANRGDRINSEVALHTQGNTDELIAVNKAQLEILERLDGLTEEVHALTRAIRDTQARGN